jgi:hypothetical protein
MLFEKMMSGEDHARSADTTLGSALLEETLLDGVKVCANAKAFNGGDHGALDLQDRDEAGVDQIAVDQDGARSALAFAAALFGSSKIQVFAKDVEKTLHRWRFDGLF